MFTRRELLTIPLLAACNAAQKPEPYHVGIPIGPHWFYVPRNLPRTFVGWCGQAAFEHYQIWELNFGPYRQQRRINIYVHDIDFLNGPVRGSVTAYTAEGLGIVDEIHVATGIKYTLPGIMSELHQVSLWPRDYQHQDPNQLANWLQIEGVLGTGGLQRDVVDYFLGRRP